MRILLLIQLIFLFAISTVICQNNMLKDQLSNKFIIRKNFDEDGSFIDKQTFKIGKITSKNGTFELNVVTELFDEDGVSTDIYNTIYKCNPKESSLIVMAFPFSDPKSLETKISTQSKKFKYLYDLNNMESINLELNFESGLLNFLGTKSNIKIYDRELKSNKNEQIITSKLNIKAYMFGIRIKQLNYIITEELDDNGSLTFQKFTETDGSYFTMSYKLNK